MTHALHTTTARLRRACGPTVAAFWDADCEWTFDVDLQWYFDSLCCTHHQRAQPEMTGSSALVGIFRPITKPDGIQC
jgi:hypothetical protein